MSDLLVRRAEPHDLDAVLELLREAMGRSDDPRFGELFRWKHIDNAFGASPAWIAVDGDRIAAVRFLMRWEFERSGRVLRAVRAVDTATHPDYQGKGLFKRLTLGALGELSSEGLDFVFNTPNDQSRPGYLKMGWKLVGVVPVPSRPLSIGGLAAMARARVPADHFSTPVLCGEAASDVLDDEPRIMELLATRPASTRLRTRLDIDGLRWRYGGDLLRYRAVTSADGVAFFRIRRRGSARELALALVLCSVGDAAARRLVRSCLRVARRDADYAVAIGDRPLRSFVPVPRAGPTLVWRAVGETEMPTLDQWNLTLGDIELF